MSTPDSHIDVLDRRFPVRQSMPASGGNNLNGRTLRERLFSRLIVDPSGCLLWTGYRLRGYGQIAVNGGQAYVHRVMYEMFAGPIPTGLDLDHLCRVRHCASPAHLEPVTRRTNILRGVNQAAVRAMVTHCIHGHEYDLLNTYFSPEGTRKCRACKRIRNRGERP